jgi:hypothetical protein
MTTTCLRKGTETSPQFPGINSLCFISLVDEALPAAYNSLEALLQQKLNM